MSEEAATARYPSLQDRGVFISGGATGIGEAFVERFAEQGARVAFVDIDDTAALALQERIEARGLPRPHYQHCDVSDGEAVERAVGVVLSELGPIRVLVNNAANDQRHTFESVTPDSLAHTLATNVFHHFFATRAVAEAMAEAGGGSVINMGSISWMLGQNVHPGYVTAKAAVVGLTRAQARELGPKGIRVNSIVPGWILTKRQRALWLTQESLDALMEDQCITRELRPDDIASFALFLASDDAAACTNQSYVVDGGWT